MGLLEGRLLRMVSSDGFLISKSTGLALTGTEKCFPSFAVAELWAGIPNLRLAGSGWGMTSGLAQEGQGIVAPAAWDSTSSSCLQEGHLKTMSIGPRGISRTIP